MLRSSSQRIIASALLAVSLSASTAFADRSVPGIQIQVENWLFIPTLHDGTVETFVGLRTDAPTGSNITSMWFTLNPDSTWSAWGWDDQNQSKTIGYVKSFLALPDDSDGAWPIAVTPVNPADHPRRSLVRGVFENDPLAEVVSASADPDAILDFLVTVGWEAARNPVIARCQTISPWLQAMVDVVNQELIEPGSAQFIQPDDTICQGGGGIVCTPRTVFSVTTSCTSTGWGPPSTSLQIVTGGCLVKNSWSASVTYTQTMRTRFIYSNCTSCLQTETRSRTCTTHLAEVDTNYGPVSCAGGVPAGYVAPAPSKQPCDCLANNCLPTENWGGWGVVGTPCAALW